MLHLINYLFLSLQDTRVNSSALSEKHCFGTLITKVSSVTGTALKKKKNEHKTRIPRINKC